jgi:hypothetical protein
MEVTRGDRTAQDYANNGKGGYIFKGPFEDRRAISAQDGGHRHLTDAEVKRALTQGVGRDVALSSCQWRAKSISAK